MLSGGFDGGDKAQPRTDVYGLRSSLQDRSSRLIDIIRLLICFGLLQTPYALS